MKASLARMCVVAAVLAIATAAAGAQTLAEAARRAEEQRKAVEGKQKFLITVKDNTFHEVPLTGGLVDRYSKARSGLAALWKKDRPLYERVRDGARVVEDFRDIKNVLQSEPIVVDLLKFYEFTPEAFVETELTLRIADLRASSGYSGGYNGTVERENAAYVRANSTRLGAIRQSWYLQEAGLSIFPE
ncbi:MAG: hypothetical protein LAO77_14230 [Acidobacteriia bacterium]|nr:hypothetical protein [Terriglobia bacterium]